MIRLFAGHALVVDEEGRSQTLDFDSLRDELARCFAERGVVETWLAEHVACIVEERVRERHRHAPGVLARHEIDEMVIAAVRAVGFADVAELYATARGITEALPKPDGLPGAWGEERLRHQLADVLQLPEAVVQSQLPKLAGALTRLGFSEVNDVLLREVALHLVAGAAEGKEDVGRDVVVRLFPDEHWAARFDGETGVLMGAGVLRVPPVSAALPRARVEFDIEQFGRHLGPPPLLVMQLLTSLPLAARALRSILRDVRAEICSLRSSAAVHPAQVILRGSDALLAHQIQPLCARDAHGFLADVRNCFEREVCSAAEFEVLLSLR